VNYELMKQGFGGYSPDGKSRCLVATGGIKCRLNVNT